MFKTKEDYLKFRAQWASYFNNEARPLARNEYGNKIRKLRLSHFILYAILRGKSWDKACHSASAESIDRAKWELSSNWFREKLKEPFGDTISDSQIEEAIATFNEEAA